MDQAAFAKFKDGLADDSDKETLTRWAHRLTKGTPFLDDTATNSRGMELWNTSLAQCYNCDDITIWIANRLVYPETSVVGAPNFDMPEEAKRDYREAASIVQNSPRGAAALLRLALQRICVSLGGAGKNINSDIGELVLRGLDIRVQQSLDIVRVTGNNAVHPGEMDFGDDAQVAGQLFALVNIITDIMISQPKQISELYDRLPEGAKAAVAKRDTKQTDG